MSMELTQRDIDDLERLEDVIAEGSATFIRVGNAIAEIQERKLYLRDYKSFEEYCQQRWGWSRYYGYNLMASSKAVSSLPKKCRQIVNTESQAREISKIPPERREEVIEQARKNGSLTAKSIREAASRIIDIPADPPVRRDLTGYPIPDHKVSLFDRSEEVHNVLRMISAARGALQTAQDNEDRLWQPVILSSMITRLDGIYADLKVAVPYAVCPYCSGQTSDNCRTCKGRGVISKFTWDTAIPSDLKAVRAKCSVSDK
jgi:hypothetical protein